MKARALVLASLVFAAGCSSLPNSGFVGIGKLPVNVLAVTTVDSETQNVGSKVYVRWPAQPGAKTYEVIRKFGDNPAKVVSTTDQTSYTDTTLGANQSATFKVRALSGEGKELNASDDKSLTVLAQTVAKPDGLSPADNTSLSVGDTPTLKWNAVQGANWYYVSVTRGDKPEGQNQVYTALTKDTSIKFGDNSPLKFTNFGDVFPTAATSSISPGIIYHWLVQSIRADGGATPDDAKAIDVNTSGSLKFGQG